MAPASGGMDAERRIAFDREPVGIKAEDQIFVPVTGGAGLCDGMSRNVELLAGSISKGCDHGAPPAHDGLLAAYDVENVQPEGRLLDGVALT